MTDISPIASFRPLDLLSRIEAPKIINYHPALGDEPEAHRWRAYWAFADDICRGIELVAYPVIKATPQGAWIDQHAWREWQTTDREAWRLTDSKRWVSNTGGAAWAKPTQADALHSIAVRLGRWSSKLYNDTQRVRAAAQTLVALRPEDARYADFALEVFK